MCACGVCVHMLYVCMWCVCMCFMCACVVCACIVCVYVLYVCMCCVCMCCMCCMCVCAQIGDVLSLTIIPAFRQLQLTFPLTIAGVIEQPHGKYPVVLGMCAEC